MIFCHEWTQVEDGTFEMQELKEDLNGIIGEPKELFKASDAPWTRSGVNYKGTLFSGRVTDGPFFYKTKTNKLITLWSSFDKSGYCLAYAVSDSGKLEGPWSHPKKPLLDKGHGHGCLFNCLDGQLMLVCHSPNNTPSPISSAKGMASGIRKSNSVRRPRMRNRVGNRRLRYFRRRARITSYNVCYTKLLRK